MDVLYKKIIKKHKELQLLVEQMEYFLETKAQFKVSVFYQPSDGFVVLSDETDHNARLISCLEIIERDGTLSFTEYLKITI